MLCCVNRKGSLARSDLSGRSLAAPTATAMTMLVGKWIKNAKGVEVRGPRIGEDTNGLGQAA